MIRKLSGFALGAMISLGFGVAAADARPLRGASIASEDSVQLVRCTPESCEESERRFGPNPWLNGGGDSSRVYRRIQRDRDWRDNDRRYRRHEYRYRDRDDWDWRPRYHSGPSIDFWYYSEPRYVYPRYVEPRRYHRLSEAHYRWCERRWRSYRAYDNTYQPYHGPRRQCVSPYV